MKLIKTHFFKGFIDGYLTLDGLAALVFGNVVVNTLKGKGVTDKKRIARVTIIAGIVRRACLISYLLSACLFRSV
ncbi:branched-chain amino acid transport system II carrier protein [Bacillus cytotoxicus]